MPRLTKKRIDALKPRTHEYIVWDGELPGFGARVRPSGKISYILKYRVGGGRDGTPRKPTIGTHGVITVDQSRAIARDWLAEVAAGGDPGTRLRDQGRAPTVTELCDRYLTDHAEPYKRPRSVVQDRRLIEKRIKPALGRKKAENLTRADVSRFHSGMRATPYEGNRALALLSKMLNLAEAWGLRPDGSNPCRHVKRFREKKRERFLSAGELAHLGDALAAAERDVTERAPAIAAIRLLAFTGARRSEILTLRWSEVDFDSACLRLEESKTGQKVVYLPAPALEVLSAIQRLDGNPYVIVGRKAGSHLVDLDGPWERIHKAAKLPGTRIHDLRHSYASVGVGAGLSLPMIGKMLGHAQAATTERYAHLAADPVKQAVEMVAGTIAAAMAGRQAEVVELAKAKQ